MLKENWDLELWSIFQQQKSPRIKIRLIQNPGEGTPIDLVFKNRHMGIFPRFLSLSENGEFLIVNTSSINSSVMFIDPQTLSILNQTIFKPSDYKTPFNLDKILYELKPLIQYIGKKQLNFQKLFPSSMRQGSKIKIDKVKAIILDMAKKLLVDPLAKNTELANVREESLAQLLNYLDQDQD